MPSPMWHWGPGRGACVLPCSPASVREWLLLRDMAASCLCECVLVCACVMVQDLQVPFARHGLWGCLRCVGWLWAYCLR